VKKFQKIILAASVASICQSSIAADAYELIDLSKVLDEFNPGAVKAINNNDVVVGQLTGPTVQELDPDNNPVTYIEYIRGFSTDGTNLVEFESYPDSNQTSEESVARGINDSGTSVGMSLTEYDVIDEVDGDGDPDTDDPVTVVVLNHQQRAVIFDNTGAMTEIPELVEEENWSMFASSINNNGVVVGGAWYDRPDDVNANGDSVEGTTLNGFIYDMNSEELTLVVPTSLRTEAQLQFVDINSNGVATAQSHEQIDDIVRPRAIYIDTNTPDTTNLIKPFSEFESYAAAINDDGIVAGSAYVEERRYISSFAFNTASGESINLGSLVDDSIDSALSFGIRDISVAHDINTLDGGEYQVVGTAFYKYFTSSRTVVNHAFLFENGEMKDLNDLIDCKQDGTQLEGTEDWILSEAIGINNNGIIIGHGTNDGQVKPFMLIPKAPGEMPVPCVDPDADEDDSGSGSLPLAALLLAPLAFIRRKFS